MALTDGVDEDRVPQTGEFMAISTTSCAAREGGIFRIDPSNPSRLPRHCQETTRNGVSKPATLPHMFWRSEAVAKTIAVGPAQLFGLVANNTAYTDPEILRDCRGRYRAAPSKSRSIPAVRAIPLLAGHVLALRAGQVRVPERSDRHLP